MSESRTSGAGKSTKLIGKHEDKHQEILQQKSLYLEKYSFATNKIFIFMFIVPNSLRHKQFSCLREVGLLSGKIPNCQDRINLNYIMSIEEGRQIALSIEPLTNILNMMQRV